MRKEWEAHRFKRIPPYIFSVVDEMKKKAQEEGVDIIDLSLGSPDIPPPQNVVEKLIEAVKDPTLHGYSRRDGVVEREFRKAIAEWYYRKFGVELDPENEVEPLLGSKEGLGHFFLAIVNSEDIVIVPSPAYPAHFNGVILAGGIVYNVPIKEEENYLLNIRDLNKEILRLSKAIILNYPNNPTTAIAPKEYFEEIVDFFKGKDIILIHDLTYSEIVFEDVRVPSILSVPGAKEFAIEFHTLSKTYSMAGWRVAFAVGNKELIRALRKMKSYYDFGIFRPIQIAAIEALKNGDEYIEYMLDIYTKRRNLFVEGLNKAGWKVDYPKSTFYVWAKIPLKFSALTSLEFTKVLIEETGVVCAPGSGFGEYGEGYVRFALVQDENKLKEAILRINKFLAKED